MRGEGGVILGGEIQPLRIKMSEFHPSFEMIMCLRLVVTFSIMIGDRLHGIWKGVWISKLIICASVCVCVCVCIWWLYLHFQLKLVNEIKT